MYCGYSFKIIYIFSISSDHSTPLELDSTNLDTCTISNLSSSAKLLNISSNVSVPFFSIFIFNNFIFICSSTVFLLFSSFAYSTLFSIDSFPVIVTIVIPTSISKTIL